MTKSFLPPNRYSFQLYKHGYTLGSPELQINQSLKSCLKGEEEKEQKKKRREGEKGRDRGTEGQKEGVIFAN